MDRMGDGDIDLLLLCKREGKGLTAVPPNLPVCRVTNLNTPLSQGFTPTLEKEAKHEMGEHMGKCRRGGECLCFLYMKEWKYKKIFPNRKENALLPR